MHDFVKDYNRKFNATIILTSHYMDDVEKLCERVIIINNGKIIYDGKLSKIVTKFAKSKIISLDFAKEINRKDLAQYGKIINFDLSNAKIEVERNRVADVTGQLLSRLPISDLSIEEPPIEEIIRLIFTKK